MPIFMVRNTCCKLQVTLFRVSLVAYMVITCLLRKEYVLLVHEAVVNLVQSWKIPKDKHLVWSFAYSKLYYISTEHDNLEQIMQIWVKGACSLHTYFLSPIQILWIWGEEGRAYCPTRPSSVIWAKEEGWGKFVDYPNQVWWFVYGRKCLEICYTHKRGKRYYRGYRYRFSLFFMPYNLTFSTFDMWMYFLDIYLYGHGYRIVLTYKYTLTVYREIDRYGYLILVNPV